MKLFDSIVGAAWSGASIALIGCVLLRPIMTVDNALALLRWCAERAA